MRKARLIAGKVQSFVWFNSSKSAGAVWKALPIKGVANTWGEEVYFTIPVRLPPEDPREVVNIGDVAYWPEGSCLCFFFGRTPASKDNHPRAASPVNLVGRLTTDIGVLHGVAAGTEVRLERVGDPVGSMAVGYERRTSVVDAIREQMGSQGAGCVEVEAGSWADAARRVAGKVSVAEVDEGIILTMAGTACAMAANKMHGVRAAFCCDSLAAEEARRIGHANLLVMDVNAPIEVIRQIVETWLASDYSEDETDNVAVVAELEQG